MTSIDSKIVIGKIVKLAPHPQADKLQVAEVKIGKEKPSNIVCGATNIQEGQIVPVVLPGGQVVSPKGEMFKVGKVKIRGVDSEGMMCSELELGLGDDHTGILVLPNSLEEHLGQPLHKFLDQIKR